MYNKKQSGIGRVLAAICFAVFLASCNSLQEVRTVKLAEATQSWDGKLLPAYPTGQPKVTILKITIPPKTKLDLHLHPIINAGVLTKGTLTVVKDTGEKMKLREGDAIVELVNSYHYGMNEGKEEAEIIVFYAGDENTPVSVKP